MRIPRIASVFAPVFVAGSVLVSGAVLSAAAPAAAPAAASTAVNGSVGTGDPYYPRQGNGGYTVQSYDLSVAWSESPKRISGLATIQARTTVDLKRFDLDLRRNMRVLSVAVNGRSVRFSQPASLVQELVITPPYVLARAKPFTVTVRYTGRIQALHDPNGSLDGTVPTNDGMVVVSEPQGAPTWFPVNDTQRDKAVYTVRASVPSSVSAISNGALRSRTSAGGRTTWVWRLDRPVSSYLVTLAIGKFAITTGRTKRGVPYYNAIDPKQKTSVLSKLPDVVDYFSTKFGAYPFAQAGGIVENAPQLGYSLETATRPVFDQVPSVRTLAHELAHQWYGDTVTGYRWRDIWLQEGFAQFASWLYDEHRGAKSAHSYLTDLLSVPASSTRTWNPPPADPGSAKAVFAGSVYNRGAATLQRLREKVGDAVFFRIMNGWVHKERYANARVDQFVAYAQQVSHRNLTAFFHEWLDRSGKPRAAYR